MIKRKNERINEYNATGDFINNFPVPLEGLTSIPSSPMRYLKDKMYSEMSKEQLIEYFKRCNHRLVVITLATLFLLLLVLIMY